jgi:hypothetical protein
MEHEADNDEANEDAMPKMNETMNEKEFYVEEERVRESDEYS